MFQVHYYVSAAPGAGLFCGVRTGRRKAADPAGESGHLVDRDDTVTGDDRLHPYGTNVLCRSHHPAISLRRAAWNARCACHACAPWDGESVINSATGFDRIVQCKGLDQGLSPSTAVIRRTPLFRLRLWASATPLSSRSVDSGSVTKPARIPSSGSIRDSTSLRRPRCGTGGHQHPSVHLSASAMLRRAPSLAGREAIGR